MFKSVAKNLYVCLASLSILALSVFLISVPQTANARFMSPGIHERHTRKAAPVRVMTRNLYLGADIMRVVNAALGSPNDPMAVPIAVAETFSIIKQTDFDARAQKIADEIMCSRPDLIGLQEVSTWLIQEKSDFMQGNPIAADHVVYDFLAILQNALDARGLHYKVAAEVTNADIELPMYAGTDETGAPQFSDLRLVDHDVVLAREHTSISKVTTGNYKYNVSMNIGGVHVEFIRGYILLNAEVRGMNYRFATTHLEVGGEPGSPFATVQAAQMQELLTLLAGETSPVILIGDFNSAPEDPATYPYAQAIQAGFEDAWTMRRHASKGYTCCFNETLDDFNALLTTRIDHIFIKGNGATVRHVRAWKVGDKVWEMTGSGLWPSDHAGVVAQIIFLRP